jgi:hypothetical protein
MLKAIETQYRGCRFRSRLEARWAVFFDTLGVQWEYEKEGFETSAGRYLPDFWLVRMAAWFEVKPGPPNDTEYRKMRALASAHRPVIVAAGSIGEERLTIYAHDTCDSSAGEYESEGEWAYDLGLGFGVHDERVARDRVVCDAQWMGCDWAYYQPPVVLHPRELREAYYAARAARFEHGESGYAPRIS